MSDWQVGDLAVCVDDSPCACGRCPRLPVVGLRAGGVYRVLGFDVGATGNSLLVLDKEPARDDYHIPGSRCASPNRFRKIRPDAHEACEEEFVTLLRRAKRKVGA